MCPVFCFVLLLSTRKRWLLHNLLSYQHRMMKHALFVTTLVIACCAYRGFAQDVADLASTVDFSIKQPVKASPTPCPEALTNLGNACQCHLIRIRVTHPFKRISFEGLMQGCRSSYGPEALWEAACSGLTQSYPFSVRDAIKAVRSIVDTCPGHPICDFFIVSS